MPIVFCFVWVWKICKHPKCHSFPYSTLISCKRVPPTKREDEWFLCFLKGLRGRAPPTKRSKSVTWMKPWFASPHTTPRLNRVESEKPGRGGTAGSPAGPVAPPCPSNCVNSFAASVRAKLPQRCEFFFLGRGNKPGELVLELAATLQQLIFWGKPQEVCE